MYKRQQVEQLKVRLLEPPNHLIAIFGPRQSGKTTIVRQTLEQLAMRKSAYLQLDSPDAQSSILLRDLSVAPLNRQPDAEWLIDIWLRARKEADNDPNGFILVLDEIQAIPNWSRIVKGLWDTDRLEDRLMHVVLLGSAPMSIQSKLSESLGGRFEKLTVNHWTFDEMHEAFGIGLEEFIFYGGYPKCHQYLDDENAWRNYVVDSLIEPAIDRDILAMTRVDKPSLFRQCFELGCSYSGQILSYNKMLGQLQDAGNTTTLTKYVDLLSTCKLLTGMHKYSSKRFRIRASSPKFNVWNTALVSTLSGYSFEQAKSDRTFWGRLVESAVGAHILNTAPINVKVYYWREPIGKVDVEVDFVLKQGPHVIGIEVKSGSLRRHSRGIDAFVERHSPLRTLVVGGGDVSIQEFFSTPIAQWFES